MLCGIQKINKIEILDLGNLILQKGRGVQNLSIFRYSYIFYLTINIY